MDKKFSLHKIWFFYTDEWYVENGLAQSIGTFSSLEEAQAVKKRLDRLALRNMGSHDYLRDLTYFYENAYHETQEKIIAYARSQGWDDSIKKIPYSNDNSRYYYELALPQHATDEQVDVILELTGAHFHKIIELKEVKAFTYVKLNYDFWGKKVFDKLKAEGVLDSRSPYISGVSNKGFYLINKPPKGRKSAKFTSVDEALKAAVNVFLESVSAFPENNILGKTYVEEWSDEQIMMMAFLLNCKTIHMQETEITQENFKAISAQLKKRKATTPLAVGMKYFEVNFSNADDTKMEEVMGLIEFLKVKPFTIFNQISEIDGQAVKDYAPDSGTF
jgi:hypothetical protein